MRQKNYIISPIHPYLGGLALQRSAYILVRGQLRKTNRKRESRKSNRVSKKQTNFFNNDTLSNNNFNFFLDKVNDNNNSTVDSNWLW